MPITVKARDGKTDLYGLMFKPTNFDPSKKYPIINNIYPGPADRQRRQPRSSRRGARRRPGARRAGLHRRADRRHGHAVALEAIPRGVLRRHGRQHAARSGGRHEGAGRSAIRGSTSIAPASTATPAAASPRPARCSAIPTSSRSACREAGNHDNRDYEDDWGEKWQGLLENQSDGTTNYDNQANQLRREEPEGQAAAGARHDGQQRAAVQHAAGGRRADQGEQGLRSDHASRTAATASAASRT